VKRRDLLAALAGAGTAGCGYALVGRGVTTDPSIKRIGVPLFQDHTNRPNLAAQVTQAVITELLKRGRFTVVKDDTNVDAVVEGEILAFNVLPVNFSQSEGSDITQASRYAIAMVAKITYRRVGQREPIWSNDNFSQRDEYDMGDNAQNYFDREEQSIDRLSEAFAKSLVAAMLEAF
jgi:hypothetical protein